jgi:DNA-binding beta-propeller fold protein YncE
VTPDSRASVPSMGRIHLGDASGVGTRWRSLTASSIGVVAAILLASCGGGAVSSGSPFPTGPDIAYVVNEAGIVPFDLSTHAVGHLMTTRSFWNPNSQLLVSVGGKTAYVNDGYGLVPLNLVTGRFGKLLPQSTKFHAFAITSNGRTIYMADDSGLNAIVPLEVRTGVIGKPIPVPGLPNNLNISPDGRTAYVQTSAGANLTVVNLLTGVVGPVFQIPDGVGDLAIEPGGHTGWATGSGGGGSENCQNSCVTPINLNSGVTGAPIALVHDPYGIAITPSGHTAYVTGGETGSPAPPDVTEIDLSSGKASGTFSVPGGANDIVNDTSS